MACPCKDDTRIALELIEIIQHDNETYSFDFNNHMNLKWKEGDSSKVYLDINESSIGKKFSFATTKEENKIRFTTRIRKDSSDYKKAMENLKIGDTIEISKPSGEFHLIREERAILILSNGVGIAAARSLISAYKHDSTSIPLLASINVNNSGELYHQELTEYEKEIKYLNIQYVDNRKSYYQSIDDVFQNLMTYLSDDPIVYVVGSRDFVDDSINHLINIGMGYGDIITDGHFASSGCGCSGGSSCGCGGK